MSRKRTSAAEGMRLLDLWVPETSWGTPVGCLATSFTFDAAHFEEQCLASFLRMETDPMESLRAYLIEREEKLSQAFCGVLVDQRNVPMERSLRWHVFPVRLPGDAIQHAKLSILAWERHVRLLIGSANLTEPGYRSNLEFMAQLDFSPDGGQPAELLGRCIDFVETMRLHAPGAGRRSGPGEELTRFLRAVRALVQGWPSDDNGRGQPRCEIVPLAPIEGDETLSVLAQVGELWRGPAPAALTVVSPFFDQTARGLDRVYTSLANLLTTRGPRTVTMASSGRELADGTVEVDIPERFAKPPTQHASASHIVGFVPERLIASDDAIRPLHAKAWLFERDGNALFLIGSSNCTSAGLGLGDATNMELNVAYVVSDGHNPFLRSCRAALPPIQYLVDKAKVRFVSPAESSDNENLGATPLPAGFRSAFFEPDGIAGRLLLELVPPLADRFAVDTGIEPSLLDERSWSSLARRDEYVVVPVERPISALRVRWLDPTGEWRTGVWPVNVSDTALLPPPEELRSLSLDDLLFVLTTSGASHWALAERLEERAASKTIPVLVDPHRKVDTSGFLLQRMRRVGQALEGLRKRLEEPVYSVEALRWRLTGPFGPIGLAHALAKEDPGGAPFFIAEILNTLREVQWRPAHSVSLAEARIESQRALSQMRELVTVQAEMAANLRAYVDKVLQECAG